MLQEKWHQGLKYAYELKKNSLGMFFQGVKYQLLLVNGVSTNIFVARKAASCQHKTLFLCFKAAEDLNQ